jgi:hypothetical protein
MDVVMMLVMVIMLVMVMTNLQISAVRQLSLRPA